MSNYIFKSIRGLLLCNERVIALLDWNIYFSQRSGDAIPNKYLFRRWTTFQGPHPSCHHASCVAALGSWTKPDLVTKSWNLLSFQDQQISILLKQKHYLRLTCFLQLLITASFNARRTARCHHDLVHLPEEKVTLWYSERNGLGTWRRRSWS